MTLRWPLKDKDAKLDFQVNWVPWLAGDTLLTSTFDVPAGLTKVSENNVDGVATVWLSGGVYGRTYRVVNRVTTAAGRNDERTISLPVGDK